MSADDRTVSDRPVTVSDEGQVRIVTIDRPERRNAVDRPPPPSRRHSPTSTPIPTPTSPS